MALWTHASSFLAMKFRATDALFAAESSPPFFHSKSSLMALSVKGLTEIFTSYNVSRTSLYWRSQNSINVPGADSTTCKVKRCSTTGGDYILGSDGEPFVLP